MLNIFWTTPSDVRLSTFHKLNVDIPGPGFYSLGKTLINMIILFRTKKVYYCFIAHVMNQSCASKLWFFFFLFDPTHGASGIIIPIEDAVFVLLCNIIGCEIRSGIIRSHLDSKQSICTDLNIAQSKSTEIWIIIKKREKPHVGGCLGPDLLNLLN